MKLPFYYDEDGTEAILIKNGDSIRAVGIGAGEGGWEARAVFVDKLTLSQSRLQICPPGFSDLPTALFILRQTSNILSPSR